ncbi:MAG TPA: signal peptidase I [Frankiaceae bacterium]|jgi:signal peptidase|nr:signal peptidase I [Frankiaceae bacterium]
MPEARHPRAKRIFHWSMLAFLAALLYASWPQSLGGSVAYVQVSGHSMDGTYKTGDLVVVRKQSHYSVGDIVAYKIPKGEFGAGAQVIHRIIGGDGTTGFVTKGDNKKLKDDWHPRTSDVVGHAWLRAPGAGVWMARLAQPMPMGVLCGGLTLFVMVLPHGPEPIGMVAKEIGPQPEPAGG